VFAQRVDLEPEIVQILGHVLHAGVRLPDDLPALVVGKVRPGRAGAHDVVGVRRLGQVEQGRAADAETLLGWLVDRPELDPTGERVASDLVSVVAR
jgi:hypothetical protein